MNADDAKPYQIVNLHSSGSMDSRLNSMMQCWRDKTAGVRSVVSILDWLGLPWTTTIERKGDVWVLSVDYCVPIAIGMYLATLADGPPNVSVEPPTT